MKTKLHGIAGAEDKMGAGKVVAGGSEGVDGAACVRHAPEWCGPALDDSHTGPARSCRAFGPLAHTHAPVAVAPRCGVAPAALAVEGVCNGVPDVLCVGLAVRGYVTRIWAVVQRNCREWW